MKKAGFFKRFFAAFIDGLLFGGVGFVLHNNSFGLLSIVYETILISQWNGQTIGKKILGIRVTAVSGGKIDWLKAFIRSISKILSALPLCLGYLWMLWDEKSQTWHDKIADTYVVKV